MTRLSRNTRRRPGRPKLPDAQKKNHRVMVAFTAQEHQALSQALRKLSPKATVPSMLRAMARNILSLGN